MSATDTLQLGLQVMMKANLDPKIETNDERLTPTKDLKELYIGVRDFKVTKLSTFLSESKEEELLATLIRNVDLFAWIFGDMPGINTRLVCHHFAIESTMKPVSQRNHEVGEEK